MQHHWIQTRLVKYPTLTGIKIKCTLVELMIHCKFLDGKSVPKSQNWEMFSYPAFQSLSVSGQIDEF